MAKFAGKSVTLQHKLSPKKTDVLPNRYPCEMDELASQFLDSNQIAIELTVALLLGALIGLERGWGHATRKPASASPAFVPMP